MTGSGENNTLRIAMWSGPRNISTALMRAFENRPDCAVTDEPFYAAYLAISGIDHPMREEVLQSQPTDWRVVAERIAGPSPDGRPVWYQKHMTHHMLPEIGRDWMAMCRNVFLIRHPARVLASYARKRAEVSLDDIGFTQQAELYDHACTVAGAPPPVIDADDLLADPGGVLKSLCDVLGIANAVVAGRGTRHRWCLGRSLVRRSQAVDRICKASPAAGPRGPRAAGD
jgi:hypothetical protein